MKRILLGVAAVAMLALGSARAEAAHGGGVSISIGYGGYGGYPVARRSFYHGHGGHWGGYYGGWGHGHAHWHDTSHWDYHPGGFYRHRNHFHYMPGHYDWHHDGHWDHH